MKFFYPRMMLRFKSFFIDVNTISLLSIILTLITSELSFITPPKKAAISFLIPLLLSSLLTSITGSSLGQKICGIKTVSLKTGKNINIIASLLRFILIIPLNGISLITMFVTKKHQAVHDLLFRVVVIIDQNKIFLARDILPERLLDTINYLYPSKLRRIFVTILYVLIFNMTFSSFIVFTVEFIRENCFYGKVCKPLANSYHDLVSMFLSLGIIYIVILGCRSQLYGARKKAKVLVL
ncbi:MAG: RDD family protein [Pseudomonadota bacterium]